MSRITKLAISAAAVPLLGMAAVPVAAAQSIPSAAAAAASAGASGFFGVAREHRPVWIEDGMPTRGALRLIELLRTADLDGMRTGPALADTLEEAIGRSAWGGPEATTEAEAEFSKAWVEYVRTLRRPVDVGMAYVDHSLVPAVPSPREILQSAAEAPSLERHIERVSSLNPVYSRLRDALASLYERSGRFPTGDEATIERRLKLNMDRARVLPAEGTLDKYILVDAAAQRLFMYEGDEVVGTMDVIVGKPEEATPMLAARIDHSVVNPYWNVPPDLVRKNIARNVLDQGTAYLRARGYEVLSGWSEDAEILDPEEVDWAAVVAGRKDVRVRQLPGEHNFMGDIKFMFPNKYGVYLHDTPDKNLFSEEQRTLSSGCVRLADAPRLARWLYGEMPEGNSGSAEQPVPLAEPVPVYITYLTADWDGKRLALRDDFYGRDRISGERFASSGRGADD